MIVHTVVSRHRTVSKQRGGRVLTAEFSRAKGRRDVAGSASRMKASRARRRGGECLGGGRTGGKRSNKGGAGPFGEQSQTKDDDEGRRVRQL